MATKIALHGSTATCVYDDRFRPLLEALGTLQVTRASNVEYDGHEWVATLVANGEEIARGINRNEVINNEVRWLEEKL